MTGEAPRRAGSTWWADDRGSGSVLVVALVAVSVVLAGSVGLMTGVQGARARAQTAADLGALAAAQRLLAGGADACGRGREAVERNGARLSGCEQPGGGVVVVEVAVRSLVGDAVASARAGPRSGPRPWRTGTGRAPEAAPGRARWTLAPCQGVDSWT